MGPRLWWLLPAVPDYPVAWPDHLAAGNHPTYFSHPAWSFPGYWKMRGARVRGKA